MGLDSYLYRTKKVEGLDGDDYQAVENAVCEIKQKDFVNIEQAMDDDDYNPAFAELNEVIKLRGKYFKWLSILENIGYWRKANAIHRFFVQETQGGEDNCQTSIVPKEVLEDLLDRCKRVLKLKKIYLNDGIIKDGVGAEEILPTQSGFFFGGTEFDQWYFQDVADTKRIITKVLKTTDFDKQVICYRASW